MAAAQQYLQARRESAAPPAELCRNWDAFYAACDPLVRRTIAACHIRRSDIDDCAQEAWAEIVAKLTRFEYDPARGPFEAWLNTVVRRTACHHARRGLRQTPRRADQNLANVVCPQTPDPESSTQRDELCQAVRAALHAFRTSVSNTAFLILVLATVEGRTSTQIGKLLGLTPGHVRVAHHRTAQKFREFLAAQPGFADEFGQATKQKRPAQIGGNQRPVSPPDREPV